MGIIHFLCRLKKIFCSILSLCSMAWITSILPFGPKSSPEENTHMLSINQDKLQLDDEELRDQLKRIQDINTSSISRINTFHEKVENLETDLSGEKELWRTRFQELSLDQQTLKEQQQKCVHLEECRRSDNLMPQYTDAADGIIESNVNMNDSLHRRLGEQVKSSYPGNWPFLNNGLEEPSSPKYSSLPSPCSCMFSPECINAQKASKCFHVFVPRSPIDLNYGSRVKVLLPSGQVGTGVVYKVGHLPGKDEFQVAVDLEPQECWQHRSKFKAQCKFLSDPSSGVIVPFSKVLMVWK
ncbi:uncharacterized protein ACNLHF_008880 isoform 2-T2 [Anomaloglossus baeobatrachus]